MSRTRYYAMPCSFFTEPPTAGLPPLAACILMRARAESLIGVLTRSPRMLGHAHGATAAEAEAALAELVRRDLVAWWPEHELLVTIGAALEAQGGAQVAARAQVDSLPSFARAESLRQRRDTGGGEGGGEPGAEGDADPIATRYSLLALVTRTRNRGPGTSPVHPTGPVQSNPNPQEIRS
jgi:hypothetical protein